MYDAQLGSGCLEGTRVKILEDMMDWIRDTTAQKIFWLTGWAGTGKSAIAWTICSRASDDPEVVLGGSFFCSRSASWAAQRDVRCIIPTLAQLLARQSITFSEALNEELTRDPDILHKQVKIQIERLLGKPLHALASSREPVLFIIDALDECGGHSTTTETVDDVETRHIVSEMLVALVAFCTAEPELPVKFLVTSRPETHIRDTPVSELDFSKILRLQTVDKEQVTADIRFYIATRLFSTPRLRARFVEGDADILAHHCDGLFIAATTALKYTFDRGNDAAPMRFKTVLNTSRDGLGIGATAQLDRMYTLILDDAAREDESGADGLPTMLQLLAALLSARMILSVEALSDLLGLPKDDVHATLSRLHAVVHVPDDDGEPGLRTLHASFGDYILRRAPHHIRIRGSNDNVVPAHACLRVMAKHLCFNISQSHSSYDPNASPKPESVTLSLEYACTQWIYHIASLTEPSVLNKMIDDVFRPNFMFWLEVMSVLGQVHRAAAMLHVAAITVRLRISRYLPQPAHLNFQIQSPELSQFFRDANSFVASSHEAIKRSAPHIYLSALPFADKSSLIYKIFAPLFTGLISVELSGISQHGGRLVMTLTGHKAGVTSLAYSPDGLYIVSGSLDGTVRVWDTRTAEEFTSPLCSKDGPVLSLAMASDGKQVVSGTHAGTVCIWNILTSISTPRHRFLDLSAPIISVAFSLQNSLVASLSESLEARIWRAETGEALAIVNLGTSPERPIGSILNQNPFNNTFTFRRNSVQEVNFSTDDRIMLSDWSNMSIKCINGSGPHVEPPFRFSSATQTMVSFEHQSILLWTQRAMGQWVSSRLDGHTETIRSAIFSPMGSYIASASDDATIRIWSAGGGQAAVLSPSARSRKIAFQSMSPERANVVIVSHDGSLSNWNAGTGEAMLPLQAEWTSKIYSTAISSDGSLIATGFEDGNIRLLNTQTGVTLGETRNRGGCVAVILAFAPDMRSLASVSRSMSFLGGASKSTLHIWNFSSGRDTHVIDLGMADFGSTILSADGRFIAVQHSNGHVRLWQIEASPRELRLPHELQIARSITFSPDGTHIASGGQGGVSYVWNVSTWHKVLTLSGHTSLVNAVIYSLDGRLIGTASTDKSIRIWDAKTGMSVATLRMNRWNSHSEFQMLGFTSDGTSLVLCSADGTISVWDVIAACSLSAKKAKDDFAILSAVTFNDGWITRPSGELLLWVPAEYRAHLQIPLNTDRCGDQSVIIRTCDEGWHRGQDWTSCWRGDLSDAVFDTVSLP